VILRRGIHASNDRIAFKLFTQDDPPRYHCLLTLLTPVNVTSQRHSPTIAPNSFSLGHKKKKKNKKAAKPGGVRGNELNSPHYVVVV
jgi:hypothetical protein